MIEDVVFGLVQSEICGSSATRIQGPLKRVRLLQAWILKVDLLSLSFLALENKQHLEETRENYGLHLVFESRKLMAQR